MEKVLFIANQFPPMGGSGVQRSVKFVKHLNKFGYEPIVFTRQIGNMPLKDETLLKDVPQGTKIIRTKAYELTELKGVLKLFGKVLGLKVLYPDSSRLWEIFSRKKALEVVRKENIKIIYSTSAPYSDHLLALYIKKKMPQIKWIVDFRDEWTNNPYTLDSPHNFFRTKREKKMEQEVLKNADRVIANTPVMTKNFINIYGREENKFVTIPNGYDEEDFKGLDIKKANNEKMTFVYTGALYGRRKPDNFFKALKELKEENKINSDKILVKLIGNYHRDKLLNNIKSYGLEQQFEIVGYVPHDECIKHQLSCDALVLIEGGGRGSDAFYTGKIFEYMNTGKPVVAILPKGVAADLVKEAKIGEVAFTDSVEEIKNVVANYYNKWLDNSLEFKGDYNVIKRYERKELTKELANVFDSL